MLSQEETKKKVLKDIDYDIKFYTRKLEEAKAFLSLIEGK